MKLNKTFLRHLWTLMIGLCLSASAQAQTPTDFVILTISAETGDWTSGNSIWANEYATTKQDPGIHLLHVDRNGGHRNNMYFYDGTNLGLFSSIAGTLSEDYWIIPSEGWYVYGVSLDFVSGKHPSYDSNGVRVWIDEDETDAVTCEEYATKPAHFEASGLKEKEHIILTIGQMAEDGNPVFAHTSNFTITLAPIQNNESNSPFQLSENLDNAKWYNMNLRNNYWVAMDATEPYYPSIDKDLTQPECQWAFGAVDGNPNQVYVYNRAKGAGWTLTKSESSDVVMREGNYPWEVIVNGDGFALCEVGTNYNCINLYGGLGGPLRCWNNANSAQDLGSIFQVNSVTIPYAVLSDDNTVLTFYYDDQMESRGGMSVGPFSDYSERAWNDNYKRETITTVVFDDSFADCTSLTSTAYWFYNCTGLTTITGIENLKTDNVISMYGMFFGCSSLSSLDVSGFKTDNVTDMTAMFDNCSNLTNLDVSNFKTDRVTNMSDMFSRCSGLENLDVSRFNTENVTNMYGMFYNCSNLTSLDVSNFKTGNVTDMSYMFDDCSSLMSLDLSGFKTENVMSMEGMFLDCFNLMSLDLSTFKTDNVTDITSMFDNCSNLTSLDLSSFKTENVTGMSWMFNNCISLRTIYVGEGWTTIGVTEGTSMFTNCSQLIGGMGTVYDSNHIDYTYANIDGGKSNPGYFTGLHTSVPYAVLSVDNTVLTFYYDDQKESRGGLDIRVFYRQEDRGWYKQCETITTVEFDVSFADYTSLTSTAYWFWNCTKLTTIIGIENLNTNNVINMYGMFSNCSNLGSLDLSGFKTDNVTDMSYMFKDCNSLLTIYVGEGWTTVDVIEGTAMFTNCSQLIGGMGTAYDSNHVDHTYARIDVGISNPGYLIDVNSVLTIQIQDVTREYGDTNPSFSYIVLNGRISGTPELTTTATITSPVGSYPITAERGSITTDDYLVNNGTLTITKAPLKITVENVTINKGETVPTSFTITYSGFKNGETEAVLTQQPVVTCKAVADSPAGTYAINVSGGEATNYDFIYTNGTLTIKKFVFSFVLGNITYGVFSDDTSSVSVVSVTECEHIDIPASITYSDQTFKVTSLEDRAFYGLQQLKSVQIQASITTVGNEVFGNCPNLSAVFWQPSTTIPGALLADVSNPNFLLYANASLWTPYVPTQIQNKIYDGVAKSITLTDGYPFYCPREFIAEQISYTHEYKQETVIGKCQGWETIALPFTVQTIAHEDPTKSNLVPFSANNASALPFWLYRMMESGNKFTPADRIQANTPYIISMPNNPDYAERFNLAGKVTFSAKDATVEASTALHPVRRNSVTFIPNFSLLPQTDNILALNRDGAWQDNPRGSIFRSHRDVQPFEAYIQLSAGVGVKEFRIADDDATDIRELCNQQSSIINPQIYDLSGRRIADGNKQVQPLRPGVYIHQGRKILVK